METQAETSYFLATESPQQSPPEPHSGRKLVEAKRYLQLLRMVSKDHEKAASIARRCPPCVFGDRDWRMTAQLIHDGNTDPAAHMPAVAACLAELERDYRPAPKWQAVYFGKQQEAEAKPQPDQQWKEVPKQPAGSALDNLFRQPVKVDPGSGQWPTAPAHTCKGGQWVATIREEETTLSRAVGRLWRDHRDKVTGAHIPHCPGCRYARIKRETRKTLAEQEVGQMSLVKLPAARARQLVATFRKRKERGKDVTYCRYPLAGGYDAIISNQDEGQPINSQDRGQIFAMLAELVDTPEGKRISTSGGYGLDWQGTRGDGRRKPDKAQPGQITSGKVLGQIVGSGQIAAVAAALEADIRGRRSVTIQMSSDEVIERIYSVPGVSFVIRKGSLIGMLGGNVTHSDEIENPQNHFVTMRDIPEEPPPDPAPLLLFGGET